MRLRGSADTKVYDVKTSFGPKQLDGILFKAPPHPRTGLKQTAIVAFLGEYGGGKTFAAAARFLRICFANGWTPERGGDQPVSGLMGPTLSDLVKGPYREIRKLLGAAAPELIIREDKGAPNAGFTLANGHRVNFYTSRGSMEGATLCALWADEFHLPSFGGEWNNILGRVRDKLAVETSIIVSGIAQRGHIETIFRYPDNANGDVKVVMLFPEDNARNMLAGYAERMRRQVSGRVRTADGWLMPDGAKFPMFSLARHVRFPKELEYLSALSETRARDVLMNRTAHAAIDFGVRAAVGVFVEVDLPDRLDLKPAERKGILFVDEYMPDYQEAHHIAAYLRESVAWQFDQKSVFCLDPSVAVDQRRALMQHHPEVRHVVYPNASHPKHYQDYGWRCLSSALHADRVFVAPWLKDEDTGRGIVASLGGYLERKPKDGQYEHACDVVRYGTQHVCPLPLKRESHR